MCVSTAGAATVCGSDFSVLSLVLMLVRRLKVLFLERREIGFFRRAMRSLRCCATRFARKQGAGRALDVRLPHQAFADQKR